MKERAQPIRATAAQIVEIWQLLGTYYSREKKDYIDGWTDQAIAEKVKCSATSVQKIRGENFGPVDRSLRKKRTVEERLERYEAILLTLCKKLGETDLIRELESGKEIIIG